MKHTGEICVLRTNDPTMPKVIPLMIPGRNPHFVRREFSVEKEALEYERQLQSVEISGFIPMHPMEAKAAR